MYKNKKPRPVISLMVLGLCLTACAGPSSKPPEPVPVTPQHIEYIVQRGDRLSEIAQTFTGQESNWRAIASVNSIENPRNLREGAVLLIPQSMLIQDESSNVAEAPQRQTPQINTPLAVKRANASSDTDVVVTAIPRKGEFELNPIDQNSAGSRAASSDAFAQSIKVIGSYYPKGIYSAPQTSSTLLMRVTPGTTFDLEATIDGWFKITTENGSGFIRHSDATVVNSK